MDRIRACPGLLSNLTAGVPSFFLSTPCHCHMVTGKNDSGLGQACRILPEDFRGAGNAQVRQLAWTGEVVHVCGLAGGPPSVLAGALADRLLVARGGPSEACKVGSALLPP